jgi:hypothetical protein
MPKICRNLSYAYSEADECAIVSCLIMCCIEVSRAAFLNESSIFQIVKGDKYLKDYAKYYPAGNDL